LDELGPGRHFQLLTDVHDTLFPFTLGGIAGRDTRAIPHRQATGPGYPCICEVGHYFSPLPVIVVSAAPSFLLDTHQAAKALCRPRTEVFAAGGDLTSLLALPGVFDAQPSWRYLGMARKKLATFKAYNAQLTRRGIDRKVGLVFLGDNGQGDAYAALWRLEQRVLVRAYIHIVDTHRPRLKHESLVYFCDYREVLADLKRHSAVGTGRTTPLQCPGPQSIYDYAQSCHASRERGPAESQG
jgi:hypothetical protein